MLCADAMRRLLLLQVVPILLLAGACGDTAPPSGTDISTTAPAAVASTAAATLSPTPVAAATAAPVQAPYPAATAAGATAVCADGTWSYSQSRSGTCSHHGGVHWWTGNLGPAGPGAH
jgi:hypothetical protein